ncbi:MAG TPA: hypothetical protein VG961_04435, partial [Ignavibacteria bacterium]|nr:hypothetical protein [Ignavibacteria bacterium]
MNKNSQYSLKSTSKLKVLAFLVFCLMFCQSLSSQFYWQKTYNSYIGGDDEGYDGCVADGSNFYIVGYTGIQDYYMYVLKMNQLGDTLWTRTIIGGIAKAVAPSNDGGCVFTGERNSCFSMKLDLNGNVVWDKSYPTGAETRDITQTGDSGYVMCGGFFSGYICKLDTLGNLQWEKYYNDSPQDFNKIEPAVDGGYLVCGRKFISNNWKAYFMKIDGLGNIIWQSSYQYRFIISFAKSNSGFILAGGYNVGSNLKIVLTKTDNQGNELMSDTISTTTVTDVRPQIIKISNNKYLISYYSQITLGGKYEGKILRIDTSLNVINSINLFVNSNSVLLHNIIKAPGSAIDDAIGIGMAEPFDPSIVDLYAVRIDSSLTQPPPISINNIFSQIPNKIDLAQNYPNPFNSSTIIKFAIDKSSFTNMRIFDVLGNEIEVLVSEVLSAGTYSVAYSPKNLSSGI